MTRPPEIPERLQPIYERLLAAAKKKARAETQLRAATAEAEQLVVELLQHRDMPRRALYYQPFSPAWVSKLARDNDLRRRDITPTE